MIASSCHAPVNYFIWWAKLMYGCVVNIHWVNEFLDISYWLGWRGSSDELHWRHVCDQGKPPGWRTSTNLERDGFTRWKHPRHVTWWAQQETIHGDPRLWYVTKTAWGEWWKAQHVSTPKTLSSVKAKRRRKSENTEQLHLFWCGYLGRNECVM